MSKEKTHISKIKNTKWKITTNTREIQEIIRDHFENLYTNKVEIWDELDRFLHTYNHPKLNQENLNHLNRSITQNEIEAAIKSRPKKKVQDLMDSLLNSIRPLKKNKYQPSLDCSMKEKGKEYCLTHFVKPVLHSSPNQTKTPPKRRTIGQSP
jgi:hypothetical protein